MDKIKQLLKELSIIELKYKMLNSQKEQFNIFSVLHHMYDERKLHSRFLSTLMNPEASLQFKDIFLKNFLTIVDIDVDLFQQVDVFPNQKDKKEYHDIDILIKEKSNKAAIIIENKIFAGDSNSDDGQLERYYNYIKNQQKVPREHIYVFYLSLDGHCPSDESLGKYRFIAVNEPSTEEIKSTAIKGGCISYSNEILQWLDLCLRDVYQAPFIRESIIQYKKLVNEMTNNTSDLNQRLDIKNIISKNKDNMGAAKMLYDNFRHIKWHTVKDFWYELALALESFGYKIKSLPSDQSITDTTHFETYRKGQKTKQSLGIEFRVSEGLSLYIWSEVDYFLYYGCMTKHKTKDEYKNVIKKMTMDESNAYVANSSNHFWKEFALDTEEKIYLSDFGYNGTFNLIDPEYRKNIIKKIVLEINETVACITDGK